MKINKAVFLDKDGTLVDNSQYPVIIPTDRLLVGDVISGLYYLQEKGFKLIIISNQSWIAKGRLTVQQVKDIFERLIKDLEQFGIFIDGYYFCPHRSSDSCQCHKPGTLLIEQAAEEHLLDLTQSYFVGDMEDDILAGRNAGLKTVLVQTGNGPKYQSSFAPDFVIKNLNGIEKVI